MIEDAVRRIVVGVDGSPGAEQALAYAMRVARPEPAGSAARRAGGA